MSNSPGDTSSDEVVASGGLTGTTLLVLTGETISSHELTYGLVLDTVG